MGKKKKISAINDEIDLKLFLYIFKRNFYFPLVFLIIALTIAFSYIRYTLPLYEASAVIQIDRNDEARNLFGLPNSYEDANFLAKKVELIRSATFIKRVSDRLPLEISYFEKGTILDFEQFQTAPYNVEVNVKTPDIYGVPIYVAFDDKSKCSLSLQNDQK